MEIRSALTARNQTTNLLFASNLKPTRDRAQTCSCKTKRSNSLPRKLPQDTSDKDKEKKLRLRNSSRGLAIKDAKIANQVIKSKNKTNNSDNNSLLHRRTSYSTVQLKRKLFNNIVNINHHKSMESKSVELFSLSESKSDSYMTTIRKELLVKREQLKISLDNDGLNAIQKEIEDYSWRLNEFVCFLKAKIQAEKEKLKIKIKKGNSTKLVKV